MFRAAFLTALVCAGAAVAGPSGPSLSLEGGPLSFEATPHAGPSVLPAAARVLVESPHKRWSLAVRALGPLVSRSDPRRTLPPEQLRVALAGSGRWLPLSLTEQPLLVEQPVTGPGGRRIALDYAFEPSTPEGEPVTAGQYATQLAFTTTREGLDHAYVAPNPLLPAADAQSVLHFSLAAPARYSAWIVGPKGRLRQLRPLRFAAAGPQEVAWDGRDARGRRVAAGRYTFEIDDASASPLAQADVWVQAASEQAVLGTVFGRGGQPLPGVALTLRSADGALRTLTSDAAGGFHFQPLAAGAYRLSAQVAGFAPFESPPLSLEDVALRYDVHLEAQAPLQVAIAIGRSHAHVGEVVPVRVAVRALGAEATSLTLALGVPEGLRALPGSFTVDGERVEASPEALSLPPLSAGATHQVAGLVAVTVGRGARELSAKVSGRSSGVAVEAGPATARIDVAQGELTGLGGIYGRLCYDLDHDLRCGPREPPARKAVVFLEEGSYAQADGEGRFHFAPLLPGAHVLLAGPGPLELGPRPGASPKLPRHGTGRARVQLPGGQYVVQDVALPPPPGYRPEDDVRDPTVDSADEGDVALLPEPSGGGPAPLLTEAEEGGLDENGNLIGMLVVEPHPSARALLDGQAPLAPFADGKGPEKTPEALHSTPAATSTAAVGVGEAWLGFDSFGQAGWNREGRLAFTLQQDFADLGRGTLVVDSGRDGRALGLALLDPLGGQYEFGDDARVTMSQEEKLALRFDLRSAYLQVGTLSANLVQGELIHQTTRMLGVEVGAATLGGGASVRAFAGFNPDAQLQESLPGEDATGPYRLGAAPVLPGSEEVEIELRGTDGEVHQRLRQQAFVDYFIDYERGQIDLARPLPSRTEAGDRVFLVVRYQRLSGASLFTGLVAGGRAQLVSGRQRLGLSVLHEETGPAPLTALTLDGSLALGPALLEGEVGTEPFEEGALHDRSSARARLTTRLGEGVSLFGFGLTNGAGWRPTVRSRPLGATALSPFGLLDGGLDGLLSDPALSLLLAEGRDFPFFLSETPGTSQWGAGTVSDLGPVRGLALLHATRDAAGETTQSAALGARAQLGEHLRLYAAETTRAKEGELLSAPTAPRERRTVIGTLASAGDLVAELDYRHTRVDAPDPQDVSLRQEVELKARYALSRWLQPTVAVEQGWLKSAKATGTGRRLEAGFESHPSAWATAFAFWVAHDGVEESDANPQAFAGFRLAKGTDAQLSFRYELRRRAEETVHALSWQARYRLVPSLVLASDGSVALGDPTRQLRASLAYVPRGALRLLARFTDEASEGGPSARVGDLDAHLQLLPRLSLEGKALFRVEDDGVTVGRSGLGGLAVGTGLGRHFDARLGGRVIRDANGTAAGGFVELGYTLAESIRVAAGVNLGQRPEVFTIDRQAPGVFLHLTAGFGGEVGHSVAPLEEVPEAPAEKVLPKRPAAPAKPVEAPARTVNGQVFVDLDGDGKRGEHEPALAGVKVRGGEAVATSDKKGAFRFESLPGNIGRLSVDAGAQVLGYAPVEVEVGPSGTVELGVRPAPTDVSRPFVVHLEGKAYQAEPVDRLSTSLAAWIAALPLSADEANGLERVAKHVMDARDLRLLVIAHAQTLGALDGAFKRAGKGVRYLKRYFQATQMVPGKRIVLAVVPPAPGVKDPLGHVEVLLVRVTPKP